MNMKKTLSLLAGIILAGSLSQIKAAVPDSFGEANYLYANPDEYVIENETEVDVTFYLDNERAGFNSFIFDLYLPEGFSILEDEYGYWYEVNAGRKNNKTFNHDLTIAYHSDEKFYRILGTSLSGNTIATGNDWLFTLTIKVPEDYSPIKTVYKAKVNNAQIADLENNHLLADFTFSFICGTEEPEIKPEPAYSDSQIKEYIKVGLNEVTDFASITLPEVVAWESTDNELMQVTSDGEGTATSFGHVYVIGKNAQGEDVVVFSVFVCPTLTIENGSGVIYSHHVLYNTRPKIKLAPGEGYLVNGVTHDKNDIQPVLIENDGSYIPEQPITKDSVINLSLEKDENGGPSTGNGSVMSDSNIRIYVSGHHVKIVGATPGSVVTMENLNGVRLYEDTYHTIDVIDAGIYIVEVEGHSFKILVR